MTMEIKLTPEKVARIMGIIVITLIVLSTAGYVSRFYLGYNSKLISGFSLGYEWNIPTYYQSISLLFCAGLLMVIAMFYIKERRKYALHWGLLSAIFFYISVDEMLAIHEALIIPVKTLFNTRGLLYFAWVIPFGILVVILLIVYARFLIELPKRIRALFLAAGGTYVLGALGLEMLSGRHYEFHGRDNFSYVMYQTVEESLEMAGVIIFVYALMSHIGDDIKKIALDFE